MSVDKKSEIRGDRKERVLGKLIAIVMKLSSLTHRYRVDGLREIIAPTFTTEPIVFALWHNRVFTMPPLWQRTGGKLRKTAVLTSASKDGTILASVMGFFGLSAIRGSSSRRGVAALIGMKKALLSGTDVCMTPDGPRGPRYKVQPGIIKVAQATNANIVPIHVTYHWALRLKTWDRFVIPLPFSKVTVVFDTPRRIHKGISEEEYEAERLSLENCLIEGADDAHL